MAIFTSLLSAHTHITCMWSLGCGGGTVGSMKVIAGCSARQFERDDGVWRVGIRCIEHSFDLPLKPGDFCI